MSEAKEHYVPPTLEDIRKALGEKTLRKPISIKPRKCRDAQDYIAKLDEIYRKTKKSNIQFD